jgi:hypothetical protein
MPLTRKKPLVRKSWPKNRATIKSSGFSMKRKTPIRLRGKKPKAAQGLEKLHLARIGAMPCVVTGKPGIVLHHVMKCPGKKTRRDHRFVVPLIPELHNMGDRSVHMLGSEDAFKREHGIDLASWAVREWERTVALLA